jgi:hypothetical protein
MAQKVVDHFADVLVAAGVKRIYGIVERRGRGDDLIDLAEANLWQ